MLPMSHNNEKRGFREHVSYYMFHKTSHADRLTFKNTEISEQPWSINSFQYTFKSYKWIMASYFEQSNKYN